MTTAITDAPQSEWPALAMVLMPDSLRATDPALTDIHSTIPPEKGDL